MSEIVRQVTIWHAILAALATIGFMLLATKARGNTFMVLLLAAFLFFVLGSIIIYLLIIQARIEALREATDYGMMLAKLDDNGRRALGIMFPAFSYQMHRGKLEQHFEKTNVPMDLFVLFLEDSGRDFIASERNWSTKDRPRWAWQEIYDWLWERDYIIPDSAAGSHSWRWNQGAYQLLCAYWLRGRSIPDLNKLERNTTTSPPPEDASQELE